MSDDDKQPKLLGIPSKIFLKVSKSMQQYIFYQKVGSENTLRFFLNIYNRTISLRSYLCTKNKYFDVC